MTTYISVTYNQRDEVIVAYNTETGYYDPSQYNRIKELVKDQPGICRMVDQKGKRHMEYTITT